MDLNRVQDFVKNMARPPIFLSYFRRLMKDMIVPTD